MLLCYFIGGGYGAIHTTKSTHPIVQWKGVEYISFVSEDIYLEALFNEVPSRSTKSTPKHTKRATNLYLASCSQLLGKLQLHECHSEEGFRGLGSHNASGTAYSPCHALAKRH